MCYSGKLYGDVSSAGKLVGYDSKYYTTDGKSYDPRNPEFKYYSNAVQSSRTYSSESRYGHGDSGSVKSESEDVHPSYHTYHTYDPNVQSHMATHS